MAQEAAALGRIGRRPQALGVGAELIDRGAPADVLGLAADAADQGAAMRGRRFVERGHRRGLGMRAGDKAAPRQSEDAAPEAGGVEHQGGIDRGQAGADQQDSVVFGQAVAELARPGIGDVDRRGQHVGGHAARGFGLEIADRQHDMIGVDDMAVGEMEGLAVRARDDVGHFAGDADEPVVRRVGEQFLEIGAVEPPFGEGLAVARAARFEPFGEMIAARRERRSSPPRGR